MNEIWNQIQTFRKIADKEGFWLTPDPEACLLYAVTELGEVVDAYLRAERADDIRANDRKMNLHAELADMMIMLLSAIEEPGISFDGDQLFTSPKHAINQMCKLVGSLPVKYADYAKYADFSHIEMQIEIVFDLICGTFSPDMPFQDFHNVVNAQLVKRIPRDGNKRYQLTSQYPVLGQMLSSAVDVYR